MKKKNIINVVRWSTAALVIPLLGKMTVEGWNWTWHDFLFAWVFFNVLGFSYSFVTHKITNPTHRMIAGIGVVLAFAAVWVMLATG